jgi:PII-like signaling protein
MLTDIFARHRLRTSLIMRGVTGFGIKQRLRTDRLLTLSEDLPLVAVAVDTRVRVQAVLSELTELAFDGLVTVGRAMMLTERVDALRIPWDQQAATKLTVHVGRHQRIDGKPACEVIVELLHGRGLAGAAVRLGIDGTVRGDRQRARFIGHNTIVPLMVIAVGDSDQISGLLPQLSELLRAPVLTLERLRICKRDGTLLRPPRELPETDASGLNLWQKLTVYTSEDAEHCGRPLHQQLISELRSAKAAGATSQRAI